MNPSVQMIVQTFSGRQVLKSVGRYVSHCCVNQVEQYQAVQSHPDDRKIQ